MNRTLQGYSARLLLGLELPEGAADVAAAVLASGDDSAILRELASAVDPERDEVLALLNQLFEERGIPRLTPETAARLIAQETAREILDGTLEPYKGAKLIWNLATRLRPLRLTELDPFIYAASEWEDRARDRSFFESAIIDEAKDFLAASPQNAQR